MPPEYLGESPAPKRGLLSFFSAAPPAQQDYDKVAAAEHPMSLSMRASLDKSLTENPTLLHDTNARGYNFLHQLSLAGSYDGVDVCLSHGADANQAAPNGMTPLALANCLGWNRVVARLQQAGAVR